MAKISKEEYKLLKGLDDYWKWKWIARDSAGLDDEKLFLYSEKPYKDCNTKVWSTDDNRAFLIFEQPFQFIQWEDSEPYGIAELIEEYESENGMRYDFGKIKAVDVDTNKLVASNDYLYAKESEETEVKKDIKWLNNEVEKRIKKIRTDEVSFAGSDLFDEGYIHGMKDVKAIANQLDESEVLSEYWIEQKSIDTHVDTLSGDVQVTFRLDDLESIVVPKQELPVIPQFVADWIEGNKEFEEKWNDYSKEDAMNDTIHFTIYGLFADYPATNSDVELRKPVIKWLSVDRGNYFKLVNSVRYGYEVEEEQKYVVRLDDESYLQRYEIDNKNIVTPFRVVGHLKEAAIRFDNRKKAEMVAELVEGKAEELEE